MSIPRLSEATLPDIPSNVATPSYDRRAHENGIVHIGPGNFFRGHQAFYLDQLRQKGDLSWAMRGVGILPSDAGTLNALAQQDGLYCLTEKHPSGEISHRVIGSLYEVNTPADSEQILDWLSDPSTKIVTMTVTEGGYLRQPDTGEFMADSPLPREEAARALPQTTFGFLVRALERRKAAGVAPFTVLSCDNLLGNGHAARDATLGFAKVMAPEIVAWLEAEGSFPCAMVDSITPAATDADRALASKALGVVDECTVTRESFLQWVMEDTFPTGRPRWEDVGVQLVDDVEPYEHMKLRMLNAAHQVLSQLGSLAGHTYIHESCADPAIRGLLETFWDKEVRPVIETPADMGFDDYTAILLERFGNPGVADTIVRVSSFGSDRVPTFVLPTVAENLAIDGSIACAALVVAAWARNLLGTDDAGKPVPQPPDNRQDELVALVRKNPQMPVELLGHSQIGEVGQHPRFKEAFEAAYALLAAKGARATAELVTNQIRTETA